jgi:prepilin-type N-terminal cleavage/methylation domain-containing protein
MQNVLKDNRQKRGPTPKSGVVRAYTLIELMLVVALIGILAGLAIPSFQTYNARGKRTTAYTVLNTMAAAQGASLADLGSYRDNFADLNLPPSLGEIDASDNTKYTSGNYEFVLTTVNSNMGYMVTATGNIDGDSFLDVIVLRSNTP